MLDHALALSALACQDCNCQSYYERENTPCRDIKLMTRLV
jgi:hypothetical protein